MIIINMIDQCKVIDSNLESSSQKLCCNFDSFETLINWKSICCSLINTAKAAIWWRENRSKSVTNFFFFVNIGHYIKTCRICCGAILLLEGDTVGSCSKTFINTDTLVGVLVCVCIQWRTTWGGERKAHQFNMVTAISPTLSTNLNQFSFSCVHLA